VRKRRGHDPRQLALEPCDLRLQRLARGALAGLIEGVSALIDD
jgi:hypothetical protein